MMEKLKSGAEYYEIRLESIGGLGANLCGKMLGEMGVKYLGLNSISFSGYGSEKTGTPVKGHIRYCKKEKEIRVHSPVINPDLLVIFHQALVKNEAVWKGCGPRTTVIVALQSNEQITECRNDTGSLYGLEAQRIAMETNSRINVVMLGATLKVMGIDDLQAGEWILRDALGKKYPDALTANIEGMKRGYKEVRLLSKTTGQITDDIVVQKAADRKQAAQSCWGYANAPIGGINPRLGSTVLSDLSPSRQGYIPLFIKERCINCGLCYSTCPDMVFQFEKGKYKDREMMVNMGLDYIHCKGCLRCVDVCPVNALVRGIEAEHPEKEYELSHKELLHKQEQYEKAGPNGYITSESYFTEKRMEGGEV